MIRRPPWILPVIVFSQFAGTAIWFSGNAVLADLMPLWGTSSPMAGWLTGAVQIGFIAGTLVFSFFALADRFSPRRVFLLCAVGGAAANLATIPAGGSLGWLLAMRFVCGLFLAGIYPVGMKIAAGWYARRLGNAMGFLIAALVLGTAFPHLVESGTIGGAWQTVMALTSAVCVSGGVAMFLLVPDGPYLVRGRRFDPRAVAAVFSHRPLRAAAFGYFGHMWELYSWWAFLPLLIRSHTAAAATGTMDVGLWSFLAIAAGSLGCIAGGMIATRAGSAAVARAQLLGSGLCCLCAPYFFTTQTPVFLCFLLLWGILVVGDSPQYSTIVAWTAPRDLVGSALTLVNGIGFSLTVVSLALLQWLSGRIPVAYVLATLAVGPALGLLGMRGLDGDGNGTRKSGR